jgi:two-component system, chemotaxis family, response regulator Rcp1
MWAFLSRRRSRGGVGLHGATYRLDTVGSSTRKLPAWRHDREPPRRALTRSLSYTSRALSESRDILIIEDNPADVRLMREVLRDLEPPVTIHVAGEGDEALGFLRREGRHENAPAPRLIFLDFNLPKSDARELLRTIKQDPSLRVIPVAVLTTSDAERDVREAYELHANCYLRKPVDLDGFYKTVRAAAHFWLDVARIAAEQPASQLNKPHLL